MLNRNILCIDLKNFFASCECIERKLDPFSTSLVVANTNQGSGALTLAISPYLKSMGLKSRGRLYEIPNNIKYMIVNPRMNLYIKMSKEVIRIYLKYVSKEDLHIYSIDEAFLDLTNYKKMYNKTDEEMAKIILDDILKTTGLTATCGIGPNMLIAKLAMDLEAKKNKSFIAKWNYDDIKTKLWPLTPLSKMWGIGSRMERNLNNLSIYTIGDLALYDKKKLKNKFGVIGEELWNNANGIDESIISENTYKSYEKSYSLSQVLFKDYNEYNIEIIIKEMVETICSKLRQNKKECQVVSLGILYSKELTGGFRHSLKLDNSTDNKTIIFNYCMFLFERYYDLLPIRKVSISLGGLTDKKYIQLNMFESFEEKICDDKYNLCIDKIKNNFGKNSILNATALLSDSTIKDRNNKIGGHNA